MYHYAFMETELCFTCEKHVFDIIFAGISVSECCVFYHLTCSDGLNNPLNIGKLLVAFEVLIVFRLIIFSFYLEIVVLETSGMVACAF